MLIITKRFSYSFCNSVNGLAWEWYSTDNLFRVIMIHNESSMNMNEMLKRIGALFAIIGFGILVGYLAMEKIAIPYAKFGRSPLIFNNWIEIFQFTIVGTLVIVIWYWTWFSKPFRQKKKQ